MDPLAEMSRKFSPYQYGNNNSIRFINPDGRLSKPFIDQVLNSPNGTTWTNSGDGYFYNNWGGMMSDEGIAMNYKAYSSTIEAFSLIATFGVGGSSSLPLLDSVLGNFLNLNPHGSTNMFNLSLVANLFVPKDAWVRVANNETLKEWSMDYIPYYVNGNGFLQFTSANGIRTNPAWAITNPNTGKIILSPRLINGSTSILSTTEILIHEVKHFQLWKDKQLQGKDELSHILNEISCYIYQASWTGYMHQSSSDYFKDLGQFFIKFLNFR